MRIAYLALVCILLTLPRSASAQQRNWAFALDGGWEVISSPAVPRFAANASSLPLRLREGWRIGVESSHKMQHDQWRFFLRGNVHLLRYPEGASPATFDQEAHDTLGTVVGFEGESGVRYYFWTDKFRPYVQASISYLRLQHFSSGGQAPCASGPYCNLSNSAEGVFLPHNNAFAVHVQPGFEYGLRRDVAVRLGVDVQRWIVLNTGDNTMFTVTAGVILYQ